MTEDSLERQLQALSLLGSWDWPENAREMLIEGLESPRLETRRSALQSASEAMDDGIARILLSILRHDESEGLRADAAIALGPALEEAELAGYDDPWDPPVLSSAALGEVREALKRAYFDSLTPKLVRRKCLEAAVRLPEKWQRGAVRAAWASEDEEWQVTAVFCMGVLGGFEEEIGWALDSDSEPVHFEAVRAAGQSGVEAAAGHILALAADESADSGLRLVAVEALGYLSHPGAHDLLVELSDHDDLELAEGASAALDERAAWLGRDEDVWS